MNNLCYEYLKLKVLRQKKTGLNLNPSIHRHDNIFLLITETIFPNSCVNFNFTQNIDLECVHKQSRRLFPAARGAAEAGENRGLGDTSEGCLDN